MVTAQDLAQRDALIEASSDLSALRTSLHAKSSVIVQRGITIPADKALLSRDGAACPQDGAVLRFDPWAPNGHVCAVCGTTEGGERQRRYFARYQHLWAAAQAAQLAATGLSTGDDALVRGAAKVIEGYASYDQYPNQDNVLGPARLFFSTYLESIWVTDLVSAAFLLRDAGVLEERLVGIVDRIADDSAALIGEFHEGFSNRQVWHNAALAAVACWFEDEELAARAIEGDAGLLAHLAHGFGTDGTWHEGENYHLFSLQGMLRGIRWAGQAGVDVLADAALATRISLALRAPMLTALPDGTFPARQDARYGVSLGQPMYLELWEVGLGLLEGREGAEVEGMQQWLRERYAAPAQPALELDSWLFEAGLPAPEHRSRDSLSWNVMLMGRADLAEEVGVAVESTLLEEAGLIVLRHDDRYVSLEGGPWASGHGHPDRLHLSLHSAGVHWLPDPGTGSYVQRDLFWYRSTLAHNAPMLDGKSQRWAHADVRAFDVGGDGWAWGRAEWGDLTRTVVTAPEYVLDLVQLAGAEHHLLHLPWHLAGETRVVTAGRWESEEVPGEFTHDGAHFVTEAPGPLVVRAVYGGAELDLIFPEGATLLRAVAPGVPGAPEATFYLMAVSGRGLSLAAVLASAGTVTDVALAGASVKVALDRGEDLHAEVSDGWQVATASGTRQLGGRRAKVVEFEPLVTRNRKDPERGVALHVPEPPALDGSMDGFDDGELLHIDHDDQYRRSEEPYPGAEVFGAVALVNWDVDALYVAVDVRKDELTFRPADAPPLELDNEPDDIHSDGIQVHLGDGAGGQWGVLMVPEPGGTVRMRPIGDGATAPVEASAAWEESDEGYRVTMALVPSFWSDAVLARKVRFDLIVNEMRPGRERRAGQLTWSGGGGWVWLRGDRQDASRLGILELT
jgi:hypothetical protein